MRARTPPQPLANGAVALLIGALFVLPLLAQARFLRGTFDSVVYHEGGYLTAAGQREFYAAVLPLQLGLAGWALVSAALLSLLWAHWLDDGPRARRAWICWGVSVAATAAVCWAGPTLDVTSRWMLRFPLLLVLLPAAFGLAAWVNTLPLADPKPWRLYRCSLAVLVVALLCATSFGGTGF